MLYSQTAYTPLISTIAARSSDGICRTGSGKGVDADRAERGGVFPPRPDRPQPLTSGQPVCPHKHLLSPEALYVSIQIFGARAFACQFAAPRNDVAGSLSDVSRMSAHASARRMHLPRGGCILKGMFPHPFDPDRWGGAPLRRSGIAAQPRPIPHTACRACLGSR